MAISFRGSLGWIEFDETEKRAKVFLGDDKGKKLAEDFLSTPHKIKVPHETLLDFTEETFDANESAESLKVVLTRLWEATGVHVDWSRPVDYVKAHPHY